MTKFESTKFYCKKCPWIGYFPNVVKTEKQTGNVTEIKYIAFCPDCDYEFPMK